MTFIVEIYFSILFACRSNNYSHLWHRRPGLLGVGERRAFGEVSHRSVPISCTLHNQLARSRNVVLRLSTGILGNGYIRTVSNFFQSQFEWVERTMFVILLEKSSKFNRKETPNIISGSKKMFFRYLNQFLEIIIIELSRQTLVMNGWRNPDFLFVQFDY